MARGQKSAARGGSDPNRPHPFRDTDDAGLAAFASGGAQWQGNQTNSIAVTTGFLRATRCALPGCGKPRQDVIHGPVED